MPPRRIKNQKDNSDLDFTSDANQRMMQDIDKSYQNNEKMMKVLVKVTR